MIREFLSMWGGFISIGLVLVVIIGGSIYAMDHAAPFDIDDREEKPMTRRQYERCMYEIEMLARLNPAKDSAEGLKLARLAARAEEYERRQGWVD